MNEPADIEAIRRLKAQYCYAVDDGRADDIADLFAEHAQCDLESFGGKLQGRENIRAFYRTLLAQRIPAIHSLSNPLITVDGDHATGRWYLIVATTRGAETSPLPVIACYHDRYVRERGNWRIAEMRLETLHRNL